MPAERRPDLRHRHQQRLRVHRLAQDRRSGPGPASGSRARRQVTKPEAKEKLRTKHQKLAAGIRTPANYTVGQCLQDWLETLNTQAERNGQ